MTNKMYSIEIMINKHQFYSIEVMTTKVHSIKVMMINKVHSTKTMTAKCQCTKATR